MFKINPDTKQISITRGDTATIKITSTDPDGANYIFKVEDVVRLKVFKRNDCQCVEIQKDVKVEEETMEVNVQLSSEDTTIGELINKPTKYWYEVELNPDTNCQTLIGYDEEGAKEFVLYPEGGSLNDN